MALLDHVLHVPRRHELALLDVHHAFAHGRGYHQIRLTAKKRGQLQNIGDFGNFWITQGPAIRKRFPEPMRTLSSWKEVLISSKTTADTEDHRGLAATTLC